MTEPLGGSKDRPQFSIAALLLTVAVIAIVLALMYQVTPAFASIALIGLILVFLTFITIAFLYARESVRPFCIGAAFPLAFAFVHASSNVGWLFDDIAVAMGHSMPLDVVDLTEPVSTNRFLGTAIMAAIGLG
jgi:hypothetical protein